MGEQEPVPPAIQFALTPRQRRIRVVAGVILVAILAMLVLWRVNPFFHPHLRMPGSLTAVRAYKVQVILIGFYVITILLMTTSLLLLAWMDLRESLRRASEARVGYWQTVAQEARARQRERKRHRAGNGHGDA